MNQSFTIDSFLSEETQFYSIKTKTIKCDNAFEYLMYANHPAVIHRVFRSKTPLDWSTQEAMWDNFEFFTGITRPDISDKQSEYLFKAYSWWAYRLLAESPPQQPDRRNDGDTTEDPREF